MKTLKKDLQSVVKDLRTLAVKTEKIGKALDKLAKTQSSRKPKRTAPAKPGAAKKKVVRKGVRARSKDSTAMAVVFDLIGKRKKGVNTTLIKEKTGFNDKKIWNVINRLKTQRKIKSAQRGVYVKI